MITTLKSRGMVRLILFRVMASGTVAAMSQFGWSAVVARRAGGTLALCLRVGVFVWVRCTRQKLLAATAAWQTWGVAAAQVSRRRVRAGLAKKMLGVSTTSKI